MMDLLFKIGLITLLNRFLKKNNVNGFSVKRCMAAGETPFGEWRQGETWMEGGDKAG
jgi:hypothetical protein